MIVHLRWESGVRENTDSRYREALSHIVLDHQERRGDCNRGVDDRRRERGVESISIAQRLR